MPHDFDILKIDVDGPDCALATAILSKYRPKAFIIEGAPAVIVVQTFAPCDLMCQRSLRGPATVDNMFPPPIEWHVGYETWRDMLEDHPEPLWGCSLSYAVNHVARPANYTLVQYVMEDAFFVRDELAHLFVRDAPISPCKAFSVGNPWLFVQGQFGGGAGVIKEWAQWGASGADRSELFARVMRNVTDAMAELPTRWSRFVHAIRGRRLPLKMKFSPFYVSVDHHDRC